MIVCHRSSPAFSTASSFWTITGHVKCWLWFHLHRSRSEKVVHNQGARLVVAYCGRMNGLGAYLSCLMGHMSLIVNDWQDVRTPLPLLFLSRSAFCLKAGYDPDTDPYDVRFAVIELTPEEPPDSWLKDVFIQVQGRSGAGQGQLSWKKMPPCSPLRKWCWKGRLLLYRFELEEAGRPSNRWIYPNESGVVLEYPNLEPSPNGSLFS